jgi:hypothetical protein
MITFFTTAKAFSGEAAIRQENAIRSWQALAPDVEVILFGDGEGYADAARRLGLRHMPDVGTNERGLPRVDSMFALAAGRGRHALQSYINADIILLPDFMDAVRRMAFDRFLMVAQRWDLNIAGAVPIGQPGWVRDLATRARGQGRLLAPHGIDFFLQRGNIWKDMPPMVVGRGHYDMWLIYYCRAHGIPVVDVTEVVTVVHQNHDYAHLPGGKATVTVGEEAMRNLELAGGYPHLFTIQDADWRLTPCRLERNACRGDSQRYAEVFQVLRPQSRWAQSRAGYLAAQVRCEWALRVRKAVGGHPGPLCKFPLWLLRAVLPPRRTPDGGGNGDRPAP